MHKGRPEAFSDGLLAIIVTIMVLEIKVPHGVVLLMSGVAYIILQNCIIAIEGPNSTLARAAGRDFKGKASPPLYCLAIAASF